MENYLFRITHKNTGNQSTLVILANDYDEAYEKAREIVNLHNFTLEKW